MTLGKHADMVLQEAKYKAATKKKQHREGLDLIWLNYASAFTFKHAGGSDQRRDRALSEDEKNFFKKVAHENNKSLSRDNYLACLLLVCLCVHKSELCEAKWEEFDLEEAM